MRVLQINQNYKFGSTGRIMKEINDVINLSGNEGYMLSAYSIGADPNLYTMSKLPNGMASRINILKHRFIGLSGYTSFLSTQKAIRWIDKIEPDIVHLHNVHGDWINIRMLFEYLKLRQYPIVWTLHDCWSFTGRCSHFENNGCYQWRDGCFHCPNMKVYPKSYFFDFSNKMWKDKKQWLSGFKEMRIVTPSDWLGNYVKESMLRCYPVVTINNGIDLTQFRWKKTKSKYLLKENRHVVLGVASSWTKWKGLDDIIKLHSILDPVKYVIVVVGLNARQYESMPEGIVSLKRTKNAAELAEIYSQASVFINPTYQDNYPTVNLEAIACGTPVVTYETGGSVESVTPETGLIVKKGDLNAMAEAIETICNSNINYSEKCITYAQQHFNKSDRYQDYLALYESIKMGHHPETAQNRIVSGNSEL